MENNEYFERVKKNIGLDESQIKDNLAPYYDMVYEHPGKKTKAEKIWGSVENYVNVLYWIKFVKKYNPTEMAKVTESRNSMQQLYFFGWYNNSDSITECKVLHEQEMDKLYKIRDEFNCESPMFESMEFMEETKNSRGKLTQSAMKYIGHYDCSSEEEFIRKMYYYVHCCKLTSMEIGLIYDVSRRAVQQQLKNINLNLSMEESQQRAALKRDYVRGSQTMRKTKIKALENQGLFGSNTENLCRTMMEVVLSEKLDTEKYEFVVGLNTRSIVPPQEVDIPVVVIEKGTNKIMKFAVEISGKFWHDIDEVRERDEEKVKRLENTDWILIVQYINKKYDYEVNDNIRGYVGEICDKIVSYCC